MPLIKKRSKAAFEHNVKAEIGAGKPQKQALAIAFSVKRKAPKKMAKGGKVDHEAGVHREHGTGIKDIPKNRSSLGATNQMAKEYPQHKIARKEQAKEIHHQIMEEAAKIQPKLKGLAEGGRVQARPVSHSKMAESKAFSTKCDCPDCKTKYADGGGVDRTDRQKGKEMSEGAMQGGSLSDAWHGLTHPKWAEGGEVTEREEELEQEDPPMPEHSYHDDEEALDHAASIVEAVMAKRKRLASGGILEHKDGRVEHEGDEMLKEGEADLDDNAREIPNMYYHQNEDEALEENYDHDLMEKDQPKDSNERDREIEGDLHDMVSRIRAKIKARHK